MSTSSSSQKIPLGRKIDEGFRQFVYLLRGRSPWIARDFSHLERQLAEYDELCRRYTEKPLRDCVCLEIGTGQRPYRFLMLQARGIDVAGLDLDYTIMSPQLRDWLALLRRNGFERFCKTFGRHILFDRFEDRQLRRYLASFSAQADVLDVSAVRCGDASEAGAWPQAKFDLIYTEDVFEHVPADKFDRMCGNAAGHLTEKGILLARPMVFTGIKGGHNVEWYDAIDDKKRNCPPWDHLRAQQFPANTYLNRMRLNDYRAAFQRHFDVLLEKQCDHELGRSYLSDEIRAELSGYSEEELFSNHVLFILRRKLG